MACFFSLYFPSCKYIAFFSCYSWYVILLSVIFFDCKVHVLSSCWICKLSLFWIYIECYFYISSFFFFWFSFLELSCYCNISFIWSFWEMCKSCYSKCLSICIPVTCFFSLYFPSCKYIAFFSFYSWYVILLFVIFFDCKCYNLGVCRISEVTFLWIYIKVYNYISSFFFFWFSFLELSCYCNISFIWSFWEVCKSCNTKCLSICIPVACFFSLYFPSCKYIAFFSCYSWYVILLSVIFFDCKVHVLSSCWICKLSLFWIYIECYFYISSFFFFWFSFLELSCYCNISFIWSFWEMCKSCYSKCLSICIPVTCFFSLYFPSCKYIAFFSFYSWYVILLFVIFFDCKCYNLGVCRISEVTFLWIYIKVYNYISSFFFFFKLLNLYINIIISSICYFSRQIILNKCVSFWCFKICSAKCCFFSNFTFFC